MRHQCSTKRQCGSVAARNIRVITFAAMAALLLSSCATSYRPQYAFEGFKWTSSPPGARVVVHIHTRTSQGHVRRDTKQLELTTPYIHPTDGMTEYAQYQGVRINFDYTVDVLKDGYKPISFDVSGSEIKPEYHWTLEPIDEVAESAPATPSIRSDGPLRDRWAIIIGISEYAKPEPSGLPDLAFADDDARGMHAALLAQGWDNDHIRVLVDEDATKRSVTDALEGWISKAGDDDLVLLYWSGHGFPDPSDGSKVYLACFDSEVAKPHTGWRMDRVVDVLRERNARNVVLIADTCHAGKLITRGAKGLSVRPALDRIRQEDRIAPGWIYLVSAEADRKAVEDSGWSHGAFTHCLLEGLGGKADTNRDGRVTMLELKAYLGTAMPEETYRALGIALHPIVLTNSGDPDIWNLSLHAAQATK